MEHSKDLDSLRLSQQHQLEVLSRHARQTDIPLNPSASILNEAYLELPSKLPEQGLGIESTTKHLIETISPALNAASLSPNYYGFVTGGVTPAARVADSIIALYDQNVQVYLPEQTLVTFVENKALELLLELLLFTKEAWPNRTFTTGATSSNILGLACGREYIISEAIKRRTGSNSEPSITVGDVGFLAACRVADIDRVQILTTLPHSSLKKASSLVGLGRSSIIDVSQSDNFLAFDLQKTESRLKNSKTASIVVVSCGEVNTGWFATRSGVEVQLLRLLCDRYGAWLHVDGAFGIFARTLGSSPEFDRIRRGAEGLELADSIAGDAHKLLNVPYDCGFFFCRHRNLAQEVFQNPNAAYLTSANANANTILSPLNIGIENSRRFRALPVYATLLSYGRAGYQEMLRRQIQLARKVATYLLNHPAFELLPKNSDPISDVFIIVLFRAKDPLLNNILVKKINASNRIYVSGTEWDGVPATRMAVSNWRADPDRDSEVIIAVLEGVWGEWCRARE